MTGRSGKAELAGLVLAGGRSVRMGEDKGSLVYGDANAPQVRVAVDCLQEICPRTFVSIGQAQVDAPAYRGLPTIVDAHADRGPAGGLLSAFDFDPTLAWFVLAVDMPLVSVGVLRNLLQHRECDRIATVHRHRDGTLEPLCAIWEPHARDAVRRELFKGRGSLRAVAEAGAAAIAQLPGPERLLNANTPQERSAMQRSLDAGQRSHKNGSTQA